MRLWTNGNRHVVLEGGDLHLFSGYERKDTLESVAAPDPGGVLGVTPMLTRIWLRGPEGGLVCIDRENDEKTDYPVHVFGVAALDRDSVIAVVSDDDEEVEGDAMAAVVGVPPVDEEGSWASTLELGEPTRVSWPEATIWKDDSDIWEAAEHDAFGLGGGGAADICVTRNFRGVAIADAGTGIVAVARTPMRGFDFALRVPTKDGVTIQASPTMEGVLVSISDGGEASALLHFDSNGGCLSSRQFWSLAPAAILDSGRALTLAYSGWGEGELQARVLSLSTMRDQQTFDIEFDGAAPAIDVHVDHERRNFVVGGADGVHVGRLESGVWEFDGTNLFTWEPPERAEIDEDQYIPGRPVGEPEINFPVIDPPGAWEFEAGAQFEMEINVRSSGAPGNGIVVWVKGDAMKSELFEPTRIVVGELEADFEQDADQEDGWVARLEEVELPHGILYPFDPKPKKKEKATANEYLEATHFPVSLFGETTDEAGSELLTLEVAAVSQESPIKWMRPFTVQED